MLTKVLQIIDREIQASEYFTVLTSVRPLTIHEEETIVNEILNLANGDLFMCVYISRTGNNGFFYKDDEVYVESFVRRALQTLNYTTEPHHQEIIADDKSSSSDQLPEENNWIEYEEEQQDDWMGNQELPMDFSTASNQPAQDYWMGTLDNLQEIPMDLSAASHQHHNYWMDGHDQGIPLGIPVAELSPMVEIKRMDDLKEIWHRHILGAVDVPGLEAPSWPINW